MPTMTKDIRSETMAQNGLHGTSSPIAQPRPTLATTSGTATSGQDEFFTSSVAVQHKRNAQESSHSMQQQHQQQHHQQFKTSQSYAYNSASSSAYQEYDEDPQVRKVLWPANYNIYQPEMAAADPLNVHTPQINEHIDKPLSWIQSVANSHERVESKEREYEMDIQKRTWDVHLANNRLSRSKSRSILDRAKSYERSTMNANEVSMSLPGSRRGSFSRRIPSPAMNGRIGQNQNDNFWQTAVDGADSRPQSRTDHDSRKWSSVGKLNTSDWEEKIRNASKSSHQLQGPRRIQYDKNLPYSVGGGSVSDQHQFQQKSSTSKTNSSSLNQLAQSCSKEEIIEQWMRQSTTNPAPKIRSTNNEDEKPTGSKQSDDELRRFAYDMAQSMSKDHAETGMFRAVPAQANPDVQEGNWENWREIAEQRRQEERQRAAQKAHQRKGTQMQEQQGSPATKNRQHQQTTSYDQYQSSSSQQMKQKHYFQEQQSMKERQIQAIYQQNQGQGPQQRIMEPQQQQQQTNVKMKVVSSNAGGNATYQDQRSLKEKKLALQQQRDHERQMMITERKRQEEHRFHEQRTQQQMEEEEQRIQQQKIQEQKRIQEEQRFHQQKVQEEKMIQQQIIENEKKIHEQRRIQEQAYFEEQQRLEETRFREQKKRFEEQMRMEEQRKQTEQDMVIRQQRERFEAERKKYEYSLANNHQFSRQEEKHLSKQFEQQSFQAAEPKTRRAPKVKLQKAQSFNQEDMESLKTDHFANIKTGQVNEKRHFWMRSSSNERLNEQRFQSPGPRRRWIGEKDWIRQQALKNLDNSSPQGSSFSHATDFGNVKHVAKDWTNIVKSKSSTAILQDNYESRSRPGSSLSKPVPSWLREDQASDSTLHLTRDIHTNQVKETVEAWPSKSRESSQQPHSGRSTPAPTRHIGESFADNRIAKDGKVELRYESAPTKASKVQPGNALEPSLKLVNVAVMRVKHEDQDKIKFSHTAQEQMKSFTSSETKATISNPSSNTFQEQKHSSDFTPLRKLGTKETIPEPIRHTQTIQEPNNKIQPAADNSSSHSYDKSVVNMNAAKPTFGRTPPKIPFSKGRAGEDGTQGKPPVPSPRIPSPDKRPPPTMPKPKMQPVVPLNVANKNLEPQNGLPMPVSQSWFDASAEASEVSSTSSFGHFEQIAPPQGTNKTPIPVLAGWFDEEQRKGKPQSNESLKHKPQTQRGAQAPIPPPPPPPQMNKKEKRVDFVEPPPFSPPPESDISSLNIEEMSEGGTDIEEIPIRGNVKGNIALFQEGSTGNRPKQGGHEDWKDSMKGCVSQSRQAYVQQTSNLDKDDSERLERQKELEEISKARAQTNWDNTSPHEGSESLKDSRTRELQAIAELRSKRAADAWEAERSSEKVLEATRDQRAKELQEIASMRSQNNWDEVNAEVRAKADRSQVIQEQRQIDHGPTEPSPQPLPKNPNDLDIDEMISSFQDVAASWQQRESEPQAPANQTQRAEVPSRRIGNLFKRPPAQTGESPNIPSPPPRESSKDYMMDVHQQNKQI
ncbi:hypothetical protein TCAL_02063 [Tigriopus californicus]|uniref:Uncharacterized protein n=1 Tax=Tigriopus californicus TaxID=6832 RepID=A0A553NE95_TIGCA|nr:hypothetical protein TCAL_02063 [Tigriopus californicus]